MQDYIDLLKEAVRKNYMQRNKAEEIYSQIKVLNGINPTAVQGLLEESLGADNLDILKKSLGNSERTENIQPESLSDHSTQGESTHKSLSDGKTQGIASADSVIDASQKKSNLPQTIGRYRIEKRLGEGAMGIVYKGVNPRSGLEVAIKRILPSYLDDAKVKKRFVREAEVMKQLKHPNIINFVSYDLTEKDPHIAMKFVEGQDLSETTRDRSRNISAIKVCKTIKKIAEGLKYAHAKGIVHRDLKPANVMESKDGDIMIMDFGIAKDKKEDKMTKTGAIMGTPSYMSPEQISGKKIDARADIYALGITMYELLTNDLPFSGNIMNIAVQINKEKFVPIRERNKKVSKDIEYICLKAMHKDISMRYQSAELMIKDLNRVLKKKKIQDKRLKRFSQQKLVYIYSLIGAFLLIGMFIFFSKEVSKKNINNKVIKKEPVNNKVIKKEFGYTAFLNEGRDLMSETFILQAQGKVNEMIEKAKEAINAFDKSINIKPSYQAYCNRGTMKYTIKENAGALEDLNNSIRLNGEHHLPWFRKAEVLSAQEEYVKAISSIREAILKCPENRKAFYKKKLKDLELKIK